MLCAGWADEEFSTTAYRARIETGHNGTPKDSSLWKSDNGIGVQRRYCSKNPHARMWDRLINLRGMTIVRHSSCLVFAGDLELRGGEGNEENYTSTVGEEKEPSEVRITSESIIVGSTEFRSRSIHDLRSVSYPVGYLYPW